KLELTTRYIDLIGSHSLTKLQKSFRYNNSIANVAGRFVMTNPEQYKKEVITHHQVNNSQIHIVDTINDSQNSNKIQKLELDENLKVYQIVEKIKNNNPSASISILSRYNYKLNEIKNYMNETKRFNNINYWTFHKSKGRETDYCILVGFSQGKLGFPNTNMDYAAVEALLPSLDTYLNSEERRLMYVALTRTKNKSYILANPFEPSDFVNELLVGGYSIAIDSEKFSEKYRKIFKCNFCTYGFLIRSKSSYGIYYRCNSFPGCNVITQPCQNCSAPMEENNHIRKCKNCNNSIKLCPKCNRPMKLRNGKFGEFYGCSGYGIDPPFSCDFTMNLDGSKGIINKIRYRRRN
ncbi:MAG: 3'-5' exonuclease, partial [Dehalococcoidia bacterium]